MNPAPSYCVGHGESESECRRPQHDDPAEGFRSHEHDRRKEFRAWAFSFCGGRGSNQDGLVRQTTDLRRAIFGLIACFEGGLFAGLLEGGPAPASG